MKKMISLSTEPCKDINDLILYDTLMQNTADFIHCDVMKKPFVSRNLLDFAMLQRFSYNAKLPLDIHLMTENLHDNYKKYLDLKPKILTVHFEAFEDKTQLKNVLSLIKKQGVLAGLSIKTETPVKQIEEYLSYIDLLLIMSVVIGKSGQDFNENSYEKIAGAKEIITKNNLNVLIEVDGGINVENAEKIYDSGADILVSGNYVYNSKDRIKAVTLLKK